MMIDRFDYYVSEERRKDFVARAANEHLAQRVSQSPNYTQLVAQEAKEVFRHVIKFMRALANVCVSVIFPARFAARR